jgi:hypothetical protein
MSNENDSYLIGKKVVDVRGMTKEEMETEGWEMHKSTTVVVFDDGTRIFASRDEEGNGPGVLFGTDPNGKGFVNIPSV